MTKNEKIHILPGGTYWREREKGRVVSLVSCAVLSGALFLSPKDSIP